MEGFSCHFCNYTTKIKSNFNKHLKTKKHGVNCEKYQGNEKDYDANIQKHPKNIQKHPKNIQKHPILPTTKFHKSPIFLEKIFYCDFCEKQFTNYSNKRRHELHRCKENADILLKQLDHKERQIKKMEIQWSREKQEWGMEKQELYIKINELINKVGNTNIQNNIIINNYGDEDLSHITNTIKSELLKIPYGAIPKLIESVHFNNDKPQNKNIILPNKNQNLLKVYHDNKWVYKNKNETIMDLIDSKYSILDTHYDNFHNNFPENVKRSYVKFRKFYDKGDEELIETLQKECDLMLLNHRD